MADQSKLPTEAELAKLPRRFMVAYAVRCAQRVQPLYWSLYNLSDQDDQDVVEQCIEFLDDALQIACDFLKGEVVQDEMLVEYITFASVACDDLGGIKTIASNGVMYAVRSITYAADATISSNEITTLESVKEAAENAAKARAAYASYLAGNGGYGEDAAEASTFAYISSVKDARSDYEYLKSLKIDSLSEASVPQEFWDRPLFEDGEPVEIAKLRFVLEELIERGRQLEEGEEKESDEPAEEVPEQARLQETVSPPAIVSVWDSSLIEPEQYKELMVALGDVVRASGGAGLKLLSEADYGVLCEGVPQP